MEQESPTNESQNDEGSNIGIPLVTKSSENSTQDNPNEGETRRVSNLRRRYNERMDYYDSYDRFLTGHRRGEGSDGNNERKTKHREKFHTRGGKNRARENFNRGRDRWEENHHPIPMEVGENFNRGRDRRKENHPQPNHMEIRRRKRKEERRKLNPRVQLQQQNEDNVYVPPPIGYIPSPPPPPTSHYVRRNNDRIREIGGVGGAIISNFHQPLRSYENRSGRYRYDEPQNSYHNQIQPRGRIRGRGRGRNEHYHNFPRRMYYNEDDMVFDNRGPLPPAQHAHDNLGRRYEKRYVKYRRYEDDSSSSDDEVIDIHPPVNFRDVDKRKYLRVTGQNLNIPIIPTKKKIVVYEYDPQVVPVRYYAVEYPQHAHPHPPPPPPQQQHQHHHQQHVVGPIYNQRYDMEIDDEKRYYEKKNVRSNRRRKIDVSFRNFPQLPKNTSDLAKRRDERLNNGTWVEFDNDYEKKRKWEPKKIERKVFVKKFRHVTRSIRNYDKVRVKFHCDMEKCPLIDWKNPRRLMYMGSDGYNTNVLANEVVRIRGQKRRKSIRKSRTRENSLDFSRRPDKINTRTDDLIELRKMMKEMHRRRNEKIREEEDRILLEKNKEVLERAAKFDYGIDPLGTDNSNFFDDEKKSKDVVDEKIVEKEILGEDFSSTNTIDEKNVAVVEEKENVKVDEILGEDLSSTNIIEEENVAVVEEKENVKVDEILGEDLSTTNIIEEENVAVVEENVKEDEIIPDSMEPESSKSPVDDQVSKSVSEGSVITESISEDEKTATAIETSTETATEITTETATETTTEITSEMATETETATPSSQVDVIDDEKVVKDDE